MTTPADRQRQRELERRRENELKDLETEDTHSERPLEGLSSAHTTWTPDQGDGAPHAGDEAASRAASQAQVPPPRPDRTLPEK
ncbi:MAG TPA: hypothetical protein VFL83_04390 [Anaeromyxobacter sp.]|nr:hypothetical protein [Anaeromyxobacter sp.]